MLEALPNDSTTDLPVCALCGVASTPDNPVHLRPTSPAVMNRLMLEGERPTCATCWDAMLFQFQMERPSLEAWVAAQQEAIGVPVRYRDLRISDINPAIQNRLASAPATLNQIESGVFPAEGISFCGTHGTGEALAAVLRIGLRCWGKEHLSKLTRQKAFDGRISNLRWIYTSELVCEWRLEPLSADIASTTRRLIEVKTLFLEGLGTEDAAKAGGRPYDAEKRQDRALSILANILESRVRAGRRTCWASPLSFKQVESVFPIIAHIHQATIEVA